jgi:hypothetical protein
MSSTPPISALPSATTGRSWSRSAFFCTLPVAVFGSGPKITRLGALNRASRRRACSISSAPLAAAPSLSVTNATGTSPHFSSGAATTATSRTAA